MWERAQRAAEAPADSYVEYPLELPRYLHKHESDPVLVQTPDECDAALADGYVVHLHVLPAEAE